MKTKIKQKFLLSSKSFLFLFFIFYFLFFISAYDFDDESTGAQEGYNFPSPTVTTEYVINASNHSKYWDTNLGSLDNVNSTQFENNGGTLNMITSWLQGFINSQNSVAWNRSGTNVFLANTGDNVGIGTTSPDSKLDVHGNVNIT